MINTHVVVICLSSPAAGNWLRELINPGNVCCEYTVLLSCHLVILKKNVFKTSANFVSGYLIKTIIIKHFIFIFHFFTTPLKERSSLRSFFFKFQSFISNISNTSVFSQPCFSSQPCLCLKLQCPFELPVFNSSGKQGHEKMRS